MSEYLSPMRTRYRRLGEIVNDWIARQRVGVPWDIRVCARAIGASDNAVQWHVEKHPGVERVDPAKREYQRVKTVH